MKIGIIVAMDKEFKQLQTLLDNPLSESDGIFTYVKGELAGNEIIMMQCGIGKVNAAIGATSLILRYKPSLVISTGVAGGASIKLNVQDIVVSTHCRYHDAYCGKECEKGQLLGQPVVYSSPEKLVKTALDSAPEDVHLVAGETVTGDWFVDSKDKIRSILSDFPEAMAVDMESAAIAHTCHLHNVDFISYRIISDIPLKDTDASQYFDFWERLANGSFSATKNFLEALKDYKQ